MTQVSPTDAEDRRWVTIAIAYSLASLASGYMFALVLLALELALELLSEGAPRRLGAYFAYLLVGFLASTVICFLAALPAVYVITLAEAYRVRSPAFYAAAGAGVAFVWWGAICAIVILAGAPFNSGLFAGGLLLFSLPGLIGGLVYWWFAGRTAGVLRISGGHALSPAASA